MTPRRSMATAPGPPAQPNESPSAVVEKGGGTFAGIKLLLCENPLPPIPEAIEAAARELPRSNFYTEAYSQPLREAIAGYCGVSEEFVHVNAGSELILRQLVPRFAGKTHLIAPSFALFEEITGEKTHTLLDESEDFQLNLSALEMPDNTSLTIIVNPKTRTGACSISATTWISWSGVRTRSSWWTRPSSSSAAAAWRTLSRTIQTWL